MKRIFFLACVRVHLVLQRLKVWCFKVFLWLLSDSFDFNDIKDM